MSMFQKHEGCSAVTVRNGLFQQSAVFSRDGAVFVAVGSGFARVYKDGSTSVPKLRVDALHVDRDLFTDAFGRLSFMRSSGVTPLTHKDTLRLGGVNDTDA